MIAAAHLFISCIDIRPFEKQLLNDVSTPQSIMAVVKIDLTSGPHRKAAIKAGMVQWSEPLEGQHWNQCAVSMIP